jgi:hypothetical protein
MKKDWADLQLSGLHWVQRGTWKHNYELQNSDGEVIGTLHRPRWYQSHMEVEATGNRWRFVTSGWWRRTINIQSVGSGQQVAQFAYKGMGMRGTLTFNDGRIYHWKQGNFWGTRWGWVTEDNAPLIGYESKGILKFNGQMHINPDLTDTPSLALMIFLGWQLMIIYRETQAAAS